MGKSIEELEAKIEKYEEMKKAEIEEEIKKKEQALQGVEKDNRLEFLEDKFTKELDALKKSQENLSGILDKEKEERKILFDSSSPQDKNDEEFRFSRLFKAMVNHDKSLAPFEMKALGGSTGSAGGFLVPEQFLGDIKERIAAKAVVRQLGVTVYPMTSDTLSIPKVTGGATSYWIGENTQMPESNLTFGELKLIAKKLVTMVKMPKELIEDASPSSEMAVRRDIAKSMALAEDIAFITGAGTNNEPVGIYNYPGISSIAQAGASLVYDDLVDTLSQVRANNGKVNGWICHPNVIGLLMKLKDGNSRPIFVESMKLQEPSTLFGLPVYDTTQISTTLGVGSNESYILAGQFDEAIIGERNNTEFTVDTSGTAFEYDQVWIKAVSRLDFGLRSPSVFCRLTGVK